MITNIITGVFAIKITEKTLTDLKKIKKGRI